MSFSHPPPSSPITSRRRSRLVTFLRRRPLSGVSTTTSSSSSTLLPEYSSIDYRHDLRPTLLESFTSQPVECTGEHTQTRSGPAPSFSPPSVVGNTFQTSALPQAIGSNKSQPMLPTSKSAPAQTLRPLRPIPTASENIPFSYPISPDKPWAILYVTSHLQPPFLDGPGNSQTELRRQKLALMGSDTMEGSIELGLEAPQTIQRIDLTLKGRLITENYGGIKQTFLSQCYVIWDKSSLCSPWYTSAWDDTPSKSNAGRFEGAQSFPFSVKVPSYVDLVTKNGVFASEATAGLEGEPPTPLPSSFTEKGIIARVTYSLAATIVHGRFKTHSRIKADVDYISSQQPPVMCSIGGTDMDQSSSQNGPLSLRPLHGPVLKPESWVSLSKITTQGFYEGGGSCRWIEIGSTLSLANPDSYTRGAFIPCYLQLFCQDQSALQQLHNSKVPKIRLTRQLSHKVPRQDLYSEEEITENVGSTMDASTALHFRPVTGAFGRDNSKIRTVRHEVGFASWWKSSKSTDSMSGVKYMEGEIHLNDDLHPSCTFPSFSIEYVVEMLPFELPDFKHDTQVQLGPSAIEADASTSIVTTQCRNVLATHVVKILATTTSDDPHNQQFNRTPGKRFRKKLLADENGQFAWSHEPLLGKY